MNEKLKNNGKKPLEKVILTTYNLSNHDQDLHVDVYSSIKMLITFKCEQDTRDDDDDRSTLIITPYLDANP